MKNRIFNSTATMLFVALSCAMSATPALAEQPWFPAKFMAYNPATGQVYIQALGLISVGGPGKSMDVYSHPGTKFIGDPTKVNRGQFVEFRSNALENSAEMSFADEIKFQ